MFKARGSAGVARHPGIGLALLGIILVASTGIALDRLIAKQSEQFVLAALLQAAVYLAAVWWIGRRGTKPGTTIIMVVFAILARAVALPAPPFYRPMPTATFGTAASRHPA